MDATTEKSAADIARELMLGEVMAAAMRQLRALDKDRTRFVAQVEQVTFKDGVKAVLTMANTQASHELADTAGGRVYVVIEDPSRYTFGGTNLPQAEPDQKPLEGA